MTTVKKLGIWIDHSSAHLMEFTDDAIETKTIVSKFTHEEKVQGLGKSEKHMHIKEQHEQSEYYKKLGDVIKNYEEVLLFGPTNAKAELTNILKANHQFANVKIDVKQTDKMTDKQQYSYVKKYFSRQ